MGCGCGDRQAALNQMRPGLGDKVKAIIDAIKVGVVSALSDE